MTTDNEKFYDELIAPKLGELADLCQERGMSMLATIEYKDGEIGSTVYLSGTHSRTLVMMETALRSRGNLDTLMFAYMEHGKRHGHSSLFLRQLGVDCIPVHGAIQ